MTIQHLHRMMKVQLRPSPEAWNAPAAPQGFILMDNQGNVITDNAGRPITDNTQKLKLTDNLTDNQGNEITDNSGNRIGV